MCVFDCRKWQVGETYRSVNFLAFYRIALFLCIHKFLIIFNIFISTLQNFMSTYENILYLQ